MKVYTQNSREFFMTIRHIESNFAFASRILTVLYVP